MKTFQVVEPIFSEYPTWHRDEDGKKRPYFNVEQWYVHQKMDAINAEVALHMAKAMGFRLPIIQEVA